MDVYITSTNNWLSSVKMETGYGTSLITSGCKPERHAFMDRVNCAECTPSCSHLTARAICWAIDTIANAISCPQIMLCIAPVVMQCRVLHLARRYSLYCRGLEESAGEAYPFT